MTVFISQQWFKKFGDNTTVFRSLHIWNICSLSFLYFYVLVKMLAHFETPHSWGICLPRDMTSLPIFGSVVNIVSCEFCTIYRFCLIFFIIIIIFCYEAQAVKRIYMFCLYRSCHLQHSLASTFPVNAKNCEL